MLNRRGLKAWAVDAIEAGGDVDALWDRAVAVLEECLSPGQPPRRSGTFWKRS